ncbi:PqqD family protein [Mucilaginibacter sp. RS28]|uniref:PqqD family protein n=1 Tax=Mucilaginibacter straminoryzae TaxID=2932774 RepID=A0A9X2B901_9SPHI|nr:PqqD family protein [Mucilaginibacter straminoryzae]MCJ8209205.1 PqqD family protein [Mucilaginibacter straminoryzae]
MAKMEFSNKMVVFPPEVLTQHIGGGLVLMNMNTEYFYELDETGKRFWELLSEFGKIDVAITKLTMEYEVTEDVVNEDMAALLHKLVEYKLIEIRHE